ncbi:MAG: type II toxin-antitoxin system RelE/ParE family toxin [Chloroflexi bacterium]|nr:type II toxin-antitoxin system RelE/ParE family toxin [Chloroflexota bacterium]
MIGSFGDRGTENLYHRKNTSRSRGFPPDVVNAALRKLDMINSADDLRNLRVLPGTRLEILRGRLKGFYSIRVNDQWRIVFRWIDGVATDVSLTDYH